VVSDGTWQRQAGVGKRVRVLIADDHVSSRKGLKALLATSPELELVEEAADGREAVRLVEEHRPDVVLMDAKMPVMDGLEATKVIKERYPECRVIVLTIATTYQADAVAAGADAFLNKADSPQHLLNTVLSLGRCGAEGDG
jgi:DNA-binding NarL/FixJ family response regulator